jgi:outer membrane beta-barrel protein
MKLTAQHGFYAVVIIHLLAFSFVAKATESEVKTTENTTSDKDSIDLKKLEEAYWSSKDDNYSVIQNRTFTKTNKIYVSAAYGTLINDPYAKARFSGISAGYFLNEDLGLELSYHNFDSTQNDTVSAYESQFGGAKPDYNLLKSKQTLSLVYSPLYAKMSLMNKSILYFDMGLTLGLGLSNYEIQKVNKDGVGNKTQANESTSTAHIELGLMQQLFVNQSLALRLDIKNSFYNQKTKQYEISIGAPESSRSESTRNTNDTTFSLGLTLFLK